MTNEEYLELWLVKANHDLVIARQGMERDTSEWVTDMLCFHAQQAIEKAFKAWLIRFGEEPPRTHSFEI